MSDELPLLRSTLLSTIPRVRHGFSTRAGGVSAAPFDSLHLGSSSTATPNDVRENRCRFSAAFGFAPEALALGEQRHGSAVAVAATGKSGVDLPAGGRGYPGVDALITNTPGTLLTVLSADCVPILLALDDGSAIAAVHAGWRGTVAEVAPIAVAALCRRYGAEPQRLVAVLGPAIGGCCYEVDGPVIEAFGGADHPSMRPSRPGRPGHVMLDLRAANAVQLREAGLASERIEVLGDYCTSCRGDLFYSHRRDGEPTGRFAGGIALTDG